MLAGAHPRRAGSGGAELKAESGVGCARNSAEGRVRLVEENIYLARRDGVGGSEPGRLARCGLSQTHERPQPLAPH